MAAKALEKAIRHITALLYDTRVSQARLEAEVMPFIADNVTFKDPWQSESGKEKYREGLGGFHAMFRFFFEFHQVAVTVKTDGHGGRAIVDGIMQLRQFSPLFTYPLRTILVYDFIIPDAHDPERFLITDHEEMWSFGDMLEAIPLFGPWYAHRFRHGFSQGFLVASRLAIRLRTLLGA